MAPKKRCNTKITLAQSDQVYTTGSVISGVAALSANYDVDVAALDISFLGTATISLSSQYEFRTVQHEFLLLKMPAVNEYLPESKVLKANETYTIPFNFTVPQRLCNTCKHACSSVDVVEKHGRLPPTLRCNNKNDELPSTTLVAYSVRALLTRYDDGTTVTDQGWQTVVVLPQLPEDPPLDLSTTKNRCGFSMTRSIRDGRFRSPTGNLTASTTQPHAITLAADGRGAVGSWAQVDFEFLPFRSDVRPPQIHVKSVKLRATTLYSTTAFDRVPRSSESMLDRVEETFSHSRTQPILHLTPVDTDWVPQSTAAGRDVPATVARKSFFASETKHTLRGASMPAAKYAKSLRVAFTMRSRGGDFLLPTFHTCFMSRIYVLLLNFTTGSGNSSVELEVPLQICVKDVLDSNVGELPTFESVLAQNRRSLPGPLANISEMEEGSCMEWGPVLPPEYQPLAA